MMFEFTQDCWMFIINLLFNDTTGFLLFLLIAFIVENIV